MDLDAINAAVARLETGETATSTLTLKRALKELSTNPSSYAAPPPTSETVDPRLLNLIDAKLRAESIVVSADYVARFLVENDQKLVPTIYAIKSDLATRTNNLNGAGRVSVRLDWEVMAWSKHPAAEHRDKMLDLLEVQDRNIRDLAERGWNSAYAKQIVSTIPCKEEQQIEFTYTMAENKFREKRAIAYARLRERGMNFEELEKAILLWEQQELASLWVKSVNEAHIETEVRVRRSERYRNRIQPVVEAQAGSSVEKASAGKGKGPAVASTSKSATFTNIAGHSGTVNKSSSDKGKGPAIAGASKSATSTNIAGHSGTVKKDATLKVPAPTGPSNSSNAAGPSGTIKKDTSLKVPIPALTSSSLNAAGPSRTRTTPTSSISAPPPATAAATFNYAPPTGVKLFLFQYLYEIKVLITGEGCDSSGGDAWLEQIDALRELHTFQADWAPTAVTIANNSAALAKAMIDAMEEPIRIYLRAIMKDEEICQYKVETEALEFGCWLMDKWVDSIKAGKEIDLGPLVVPGGVMGSESRGAGPSGAAGPSGSAGPSCSAGPSGTSAGGSSGGGGGAKKKNKKGKKKN
jgi:hypothetical protein